MKTPQVPPLAGMTPLGWAEKHLKAFHLDDEELGALIDYHEDQINLALESGEPEEAAQRRERVKELWAVLRQK